MSDPVLAVVGGVAALVIGLLCWLLTTGTRKARTSDYFWEDVFRPTPRTRRPGRPAETSREEPWPAAVEPERAPPWNEILKVRPTASAREIQRAYHALMRIYHPDRVVGLPLEAQRRAEQQAKAINEAYRAGVAQVRRSRWLGLSRTRG